MYARPGSKAAQSAATSGQLVAVATELFAERGYAGVGTEEIGGPPA
jgi:AcrR family transcriptional regulator